MELNLYPYNYYILYASIALLMLFLIMTLVKLLAIPKALAAKQPLLDELKRQSDLMQIKSDVLNEQKESAGKYRIAIVAAIPVIFAIYKIYRSQTSEHGVKRVYSAVKTYIKDDTEKKIIQEISKNV